MYVHQNNKVLQVCSIKQTIDVLASVNISIDLLLQCEDRQHQLLHHHVPPNNYRENFVITRFLLRMKLSCSMVYIHSLLHTILIENW